jgi:ribosomal protein L44E
MARTRTPPERQRVARTRNDGTMTEQAFFGWLRSGLRRMSMKWRPIYGVLNDRRRPATLEDKRKYGNRISWTYNCGECGEWFPRKVVEVDHRPPAGSLTCYEDIPGFVERLFVERDKLHVMCTACHDRKTKEEAQ